MELQFMTWMEVESYLKKRTDVIMPIGSTEQHGPNGLVGTDALTGYGMAMELNKHVGSIVAPCMNVGMALHHMEFPGSMSLKPSTMIAVLKDYVTSLARHGFKRFFFVNGHGGNIATAKSAFSEIYHELETAGISGVKCHFESWFINPDVLKLCRELYGKGEGYHATPSEISVTQYLHPEHVKSANGLKPAPEMDDHDIYGAKAFRDAFPDGRMGSNSAAASIEAGEKIVKLTGEVLSKTFKEFIGS